MGKGGGARGEGVVVATGENTVHTNVTPDGSDQHHKTSFSINKWRSELVAFLLLYIADVLFRPSDHRLFVDLGGGWGDLLDGSWHHVRG